MKKKILVVGGGEWQVPIIQKIKKLGHTVVNTNLYENSPGFSYADFSYVVDVLDREKNLEIAREHNVDAVLTDQSDIAVNTVAYINEKLGLAGLTIEVAELFTNKYRMREELKIKELKHPRYKLCNSLKDLEDFFQELQMPLIIKPTNNQSSRGVMKFLHCKKLYKHINIPYSFVKKRPFWLKSTLEGLNLQLRALSIQMQSITLLVFQKKHTLKIQLV